MRKALLSATLLGGIVLPVVVADADTILWVDDSGGLVGQVDINTQAVVPGSVHDTGLGASLTDIGFGTNGTLYGTTFTDLFVLPPSGGAIHVGSYGGVGASGMNALVGSGAAGTQLGASNATDEVYSISQGNAAATPFHASPLTSAGDLAFAGSTLYESGVDGGNDALVNVTSGTFTDFHVGTTGGATLSGVFGLADDGTTMYAVNGTEVYSVNLANAVLTPLFSYAGAGLGSANGTAFIGEGSTGKIPEPTSLAVLGVGLLGLGFTVRRFHNH